MQLIENTVWAGQPNRNDNTDAKESQEIINQKFITISSHVMPYQTAGNLTLSFPGHDRYSDNYRELDIDKAIV